jgi:hypothetical protein
MKFMNSNSRNKLLVFSPGKEALIVEVSLGWDERRQPRRLVRGGKRCDAEGVADRSTDDESWIMVVMG